jgi:hypothetical protein
LARSELYITGALLRIADDVSDLGRISLEPERINEFGYLA